ncbi:hypothetical protein Ddye_017459 [Dipteronia dyeriana]|uniref:At2g29880-like C-terminal domain-containing protein n=1 Tax=Dipteronia dyeriana TaxID=168575 RepID=A0AAD9U8R1_9ROSI|nr:hypothetical protein Ddye_017459 [Dipteronia dyeriana]
MTSKKKRNKTDFEGLSSFQNINQADIIEKNSYGIDSIAVDFRGVRSLMEKRESDREKREIEKKEKERKSNIWDAIKETPNLDNSTRYKAIGLLNTKTKKDVFLYLLRNEWLFGNICRCLNMNNLFLVGLNFYYELFIIFYWN